jgi:hypothetical protein
VSQTGDCNRNGSILHFPKNCGKFRQNRRKGNAADGSLHRRETWPNPERNLTGPDQMAASVFSGVLIRREIGVFPEVQRGFPKNGPALA